MKKGFTPRDLNLQSCRRKSDVNSGSSSCAITPMEGKAKTDIIRIRDNETRASFLGLWIPLSDFIRTSPLQTEMKSNLSRNGVRLIYPQARLYYFLKREETVPVISSLLNVFM